MERCVGAYCNIPILPRMRKFLAFKVVKETWKFRVVHLGLSIAPQNFTRLISVFLTRLTSLKVVVLAYLDGFLMIVNSKEKCVRRILIVIDVFQKIGFI